MHVSIKDKNFHPSLFIHATHYLWHMINKKLLLFLTIILAAFLIAVKFIFFNSASNAGTAGLPVTNTVRDFSFTSQDGKAFSKKDMLGRVCVVNYFFTRCRSICPKMNNNMKKVYEIFKNNPGVLIVSHSCDPEYDSASILKHYADSLGVNTRQWFFLTGKKDSLYKMARYSYGIDDPKHEVKNVEGDFIHTQFFALVDRDGNIRGSVYDGLKDDEIKRLEKDVNALLKEK